MRLKSINRGEVGAALAVFGLGVFMVAYASDYPVGSVSRMGPGFFPIGLGILLMLFGAALAVEVRALPVVPTGLRLRPFMFVMAGLLAFALLVERAGLVPATLALAGLSALADTPVRPKAILATAIVLAAIGYFVFLWGLKVQLHAFWW